MKRRKFQHRTIDQLVARFVELVSSGAKAEVSEADRLCTELQEIEDELKARGQEHHTDLLPLAAHSDEMVRFEAVAGTFRMMLGNPEITSATHADPAANQR